MDDCTFMSLPVLKVTNVCADMMTDCSINNNDHNELNEESVISKDYGVTK